MKTIRRSSSIIYVATIAVVMVALPARLAAQAAAAKSPDTSSGPATQWSVQVDRVNAGDQELAYSFQVAIYENLLEELNKTKQFKQVFRDGDRNASERSELAGLANNCCEIHAWERNAPCSDHRERRDKVNGAESTHHAGRQTCARSHGAGERSPLRQQFARYPQFGPQYRQNDQAIGMARIRAAGAILTSRL